MKMVFEKLSYMVDISRNAVPKLETLKKLAKKLSLFGYDRLMLYIEDTIEVKSYPMLGTLKAQLSVCEIRNLDEYVKSIGMELVPCIQTLGHMNSLAQWPVFDGIRDTDDILLAGNEETYVFIDALLLAVRTAFSSNEINIGMDEAFLLGAGRYMAKNGFREKKQIFSDHLSRVLALCEKHGFRASMWGDMFIRILFNGEYYVKDATLPDGAKKAVPQNVRLVYWNYTSRDSKYYEQMLELMRGLSDDVCFAGGAWKWAGFAPMNQRSLVIAKDALKAAKGRVDEVILTAWADDGAEASLFSVMPVAAAYAQFRDTGEMDIKKTAERFRSVMGVDYDLFLKLDCVNRLGAGSYEDQPNNASKYYLYQDIMLGKFDCTVEEGTVVTLKKNLAELKAARQHAGEWTYVFDTLVALADVVFIKAGLGIELRKAYQEGNKEVLRKHAEITLPTLIDRLEIFYNAFEQQWLTENKPEGLEVIQYRIGGVLKRVAYCKRMLSRYVLGETESIGEFEHDIVDFSGGLFSMKEKNILYNNTKRIMTASNL